MPKSLMSERHRAVIVALWRQGRTEQQIAQATGRSLLAIAEVIEQARRHRPTLGERDMHLAIQMVRDGTKPADAARICGVELLELLHRLKPDPEAA